MLQLDETNGNLSVENLSLITYQNLATYSFQERKGDNI
jgi:hypothetical protein